MIISNLTTLARLKDYLKITSTTDDALLTRLIASASAFVQNWLNRTIVNSTYTETRNGEGMQRMLLQNYPITSISSVNVAGLSVQARPALTASYTGNNQAGYTNSDTTLYLTGFCFPQGFQNVVVAYTAGFVKTDTSVIPATPYQITTSELWLIDMGVTKNGVAMVNVASSPAVGQYSVTDGVYTFNAVDTGPTVVIRYSYVPGDIEQACIDLISLKYMEKNRIGVTSKTIEGQVIAYLTSDMSNNTKALLNNYKKVVPI